MKRREELLKRAIDLAVSGCALGTMWPLLVAIAAAVRLDSDGPALFRQKRLGRDGRIFEFLKFRSMRADADVRIGDDHVVVNPEDDDRVTRIGRWLRKASLDELPQLVNVLRGEMSVVGPRPDLPEALGMYDDRARRRLEVKPGITGLAQISGRNLLDAAAKWEIDAQYAETANLALDLSILARTFLKVANMEGIYRKEEPR